MNRLKQQVQVQMNKNARTNNSTLLLPLGFKHLIKLSHYKINSNKLTNLNRETLAHYVDKWATLIVKIANDFNALRVLKKEVDETDERDLRLAEFLEFIVYWSVDANMQRNIRGRPALEMIEMVYEIYFPEGFFYLVYQMSEIILENMKIEYRYRSQKNLNDRDRSEEELSAQKIVSEELKIIKYRRMYFKQSEMTEEEIKQRYSSGIIDELKYPLKDKEIPNKINRRLLFRSIDMFKEGLILIYRRENVLNDSKDEEQQNHLNAVITSDNISNLLSYLEVYHNGILNIEKKYPLPYSSSPKHGKEKVQFRKSFDLVRNNQLSQPLLTYVKTDLYYNASKIKLIHRINKSKENLQTFSSTFSEMEINPETVIPRDKANQLIRLLSRQIDFNYQFLNLDQNSIEQIELFMDLVDQKLKSTGIFDDYGEFISFQRRDFYKEQMIMILKESILIYNLSIACLHAYPIAIPLFDQKDFITQKDICFWINVFLTRELDLNDKLSELESIRLHDLDFDIDFISQLDNEEKNMVNSFVVDCIKNKKSIFNSQFRYIIPFPPLDNFESNQQLDYTSENSQYDAFNFEDWKQVNFNDDTRAITSEERNLLKNSKIFSILNREELAIGLLTSSSIISKRR